MVAASRALPHPTPTLANVFERLLADIVAGKYPPGANLPAERDLARTLGASRPTLREALRRLGEWGMVSARRGSGVVVRDVREWSIDVLPAFLRLGAAAKEGPAALASLIVGVLQVRRSLFVEVLRIVGPRLVRGSLIEARAHVERAWTARDDIATFVREDFEAVRAVVDAGGFLPALWLLNGVAGVYGEIARTLTGAAMVPPDYLETYHTAFDHFEAGRTEDACAVLSAYLQRHDRRLLAALGVSS